MINRFKEIESHPDSDVNRAINRITSHKNFPQIAEFAFGKMPLKNVLDFINSIHTVDDFQKKVMRKAIQSSLKKTSSGMSASNFEKIDRNKPYLYISNHRDIVLDSAILQIALIDKDIPTSEISFGSNLIMNDLTEDIIICNRMFKVIRSACRRDIVDQSKLLSDYIRHTITNKKRSAWIAQRNGRTKDGLDKTEPGLLKMLNMSGSGDFVDSFKEMNIIPMSISYEYEPCADKKLQEIYLSSRGRYKKQEGEDLQSVISGIVEFKGKIDISIGDPITVEELKDADSLERNKKSLRLAEIIDERITNNFTLWKNNYIAYDRLHGEGVYSSMYTDADVIKFLTYKHETLNKVEGVREEVLDLFLKMYANPVINKRKLEGKNR